MWVNYLEVTDWSSPPGSVVICPGHTHTHADESPSRPVEGYLEHLCGEKAAKGARVKRGGRGVGRVLDMAPSRKRRPKMVYSGGLDQTVLSCCGMKLMPCDLVFYAEGFLACVRFSTLGWSLVFNSHA